jgi:hypothetical protein
MPDTQIHPFGTEPAPADYNIPAAAELLLKGAFAKFDGSGAAGAFVPLLRIISDAGSVSLEAPQDVTVAAGGSADASWFPHVGVSAAAATPSNPGLMAARVNIVGAINIPEGDPGTLVAWGESIVDTGTPTPFWSNAHPTRLTAPANGVYLTLGNLEWSVLGAGNAPAYVGTYLYKNGTPTPGYFYEYNNAEPNIGVSYNLTAGSHSVFPMQAGDYMEILAYNFNNGGAARSLIDLRPAENHYSSFAMILVGTT